MSNDERLRSLTLIHSMSLGCLRMFRRIKSENVNDLYVQISGKLHRFKVLSYLELHRSRHTTLEHKRNIRCIRRSLVREFQYQIIFVLK